MTAEVIIFPRAVIDTKRPTVQVLLGAYYMPKGKAEKIVQRAIVNSDTNPVLVAIRNMVAALISIELSFHEIQTMMEPIVMAAMTRTCGVQIKQAVLQAPTKKKPFWRITGFEWC